ncbi:hypothetical protein [Arthrobacter woluwensis]|uniref:hypothetical protein n=1 Tax=Arthrobacter woluwensis TaxID=156980 RepID=UPI0011AAF302|nr:hypothetical protein [Arthrobacter woluwensis]
MTGPRAPQDNREQRLAAAAYAIEDHPLCRANPPRHRRSLAAALAEAAIAAADAVDVARRPGHVAEIADGRYYLQHPIECRPNLLDCDIDRRLRKPEWAPILDQMPPGRYLADIRDNLLYIRVSPSSKECEQADHHKCPGAVADMVSLVARRCACTCHEPAQPAAA